MSYNILPADLFIVINKAILNEQKRKILIMLYQPIIGSNAVNLYETLWSFLDQMEISSKEMNHYQIIASMQIKLSAFEEAKNKLEAIGLLKTYIKKDDINHVVYELYSPLSAYEFFNNPLLSVNLLASLGKETYERILNYYKLPVFDVSTYQDVTSKFDDVFKFENNQKAVEYSQIRENKYSRIDFKETIDIKNVISMISSDLLNKQKINKKTMEILIKLAYVYNFNDLQMVEIIKNSIDQNKNIDIEMMKKNSHNYYKFNNGGQVPFLIDKNQPEHLRLNNSINNIKTKMIAQFENLTPNEYLCLKNKTNKLTNQEIDILQSLLVDLDLNPGVVNVLIDYVLKINNHKLTKNYILTIASQFKRANIKTVQEAMDFAKENQAKPKQRVTTKKNNIKPEWLDQNIESEEVTLEDQERIKELLKGFD
jgi:replication initiation and membrane attachment protein